MPMTWMRRVTPASMPVTCDYPKYAVPGVLTKCGAAFTFGLMTAPTRDEFSERLLKGSVKKSYAPIVDIDWDAPLDPDKFFLPPKTVSLYGTPLWDSMSREQQIELSRQEL